VPEPFKIANNPITYCQMVDTAPVAVHPALVHKRPALGQNGKGISMHWPRAA